MLAESFVIRVATYASVKNCELYVKLYDSASNDLIQSWSENAKGIGDNSFCLFVLDEKIENTKDHLYRIEITSNAKSGNAVTLWKNTENLFQGDLSINQQHQDGQIVLGFNAFYSSSRINYGYLFSICFVVLISIWFIFSRKIYIKVFRQFVMTCQSLIRYRKKIALFAIAEILVVVVLVLIELFLFRKQNLSTALGYINEYRVAVSAAAATVFLLFVFTHKQIGKHPEYVFTAILIILGALFIYCLPSEVFVSWDEAIHYFRAVSLSNCITGNVNAAEKWLYTNNGLRPENYRESVQLMQSQIAFQQLYDTGSIATVKSEYLNKIWTICYLPSALGLKIGKWLGLPYVHIFRLGEVGNMTLYIVLSYLSIKKVKSGKMIVAVISLMVTPMFLAARYSYDTWVTSFYLLGTAYFISIFQEEKQDSSKDRWIALLAFFVGSFAKVIYFPIMGCLLLIPKDRFTSYKDCQQYRVTVIASMLMLAAGMILSIWLLLVIWVLSWVFVYSIFSITAKMKKRTRAITIVLFGGSLIVIGYYCAVNILPGVLGIGDTRGGDVNAGAQFLHILQHPIQYLKVLLRFLTNTYLNYGASDGWAYNLGSLAYIGLSKWKFIPAILLLFVSITDKNQVDQWKEEKTVRVFMILGSLLTICMIATVLYIDFTPYLYGEILGCQARYMLPLFLPVFIILGSSKIQNQFNRNRYNMAVLGTSCFILLVNIWNMVASQYC